MPIQRSIATALLSLLLYLPSSLTVAGYSYLPAAETFKPDIPLPEHTLGFQVGQWHARPEQIAQYMTTLADSSPRATVIEIGRTPEQRPLQNLIITSPENHAQLETLRQQHLSGKVNDNSPLIIWLGYSIHGTEPSGSNAALLVAYHLIAGEAPWIKTLLKNTIVIIDPMMNPDGLARHATWVNMHRGQQLVGDALDRSHYVGWPMGRFNHYWFDMNRDWLPATQPESVARLRQFYRWQPHIQGDFHEGGVNAYFFQPGIPTRQNPLISKENVAITTALAKYHAQALDGISHRYYSGESYDDFYPGKGSTFPDLNASIGILYEALPIFGHKRDSDHGDFTFTDVVQSHYVTSLSTLVGAHDIRERLLHYPQRFRTQAAERAKKQKGRAWIFADDGDHARAKALVELLKLHNIDVYALTEDIKANNNTTFYAGKAWVVPIRQRQSTLVEAIFEQRTTFNDNAFYDVSAWTLPSAFNLPFSWVRSLPDRPTPALSTHQADSSFFTSQANASAYRFSATGLANSAMALHLMNKGIRVYRVGYPKLNMASDSTMHIGDFVVPVPFADRGEGRKSLEETLAAETSRWQVPVQPISSGFNLSGPDVGSPNIHLLKAVKPLLVTGKGVVPTEAGHIWHLIDRRLGLPLPMIDVRHPAALNLSDYTHLLIPDLEPSALPKSWHEPIKDWVKGGGVLVTQKRSARWAEALFSQRPKEALNEPSEEKRIEKLIADISANDDTSYDTLGRLAYGQCRHDAADRTLGGAIFSAELDLTHPLSQGYQRVDLPVFLNSFTQLEFSKNAYSTPLVLSSSKPLAGFASDFANKALKDKPLLVADKVGKGLVVKFAFNPNFRGFWRGTEGLYINTLVNAPLVTATVLPKH